MRILVCGSRYWTDKEAIRQHLRQWWLLTKEPMVIIHGGCRGADLLAAAVGKEQRCLVQRYNADWAKYGKAAGPIRNAQMLTEGQPDMVLAFHENLDNSKGTKDMVDKARKAGIMVKVIEGRIS